MQVRFLLSALNSKLGDADRKAQALVPVCCFVNKAVIRKAGNKYAIRK